MGYDMYAATETGQRVETCPTGEHKHSWNCPELYWRRSAGSGYRQADRLVELGLAYWPADGKTAPAPWPEEPADIKRDADGDIADWDTGIYYDDRYQEAITKHLRETYDERPGIAAYKLCYSNDGWWVTKAECASALALWERAGKPVDWDFEHGDLEPFLRYCAANHGFTVH